MIRLRYPEWCWGKTFHFHPRGKQLSGDMVSDVLWTCCFTSCNNVSLLICYMHLQLSCLAFVNATSLFTFLPSVTLTPSLCQCAMYCVYPAIRMVLEAEIKCGETFLPSLLPDHLLSTEMITVRDCMCQITVTPRTLPDGHTRSWTTHTNTWHLILRHYLATITSRTHCIVWILTNIPSSVVASCHVYERKLQYVPVRTCLLKAHIVLELPKF